MQVLVTGAAGRIGKMLRLAWAKGDFTDLQPIWCARRASYPTYLQWDILSNAAPAIPHGAVILHLAAVLQGDARALANNTEMALKVCAVAQAAGAKHVFVASSAAVYGRNCGELTEGQSPHPVSDYGRAKLSMERQVRLWSKNAGLRSPKITCLRIGNIVGADALIGQADQGKPMILDTIPGHSCGLMRSYIGPHTLAFVLAQILRRAGLDMPIPKILNVATQHPVLMSDLLDAAKVGYQLGPPRKNAIAKVWLSTARLAKLVHVPDQNAFDMIEDWQSLMVPTP